MSMMISPMMLHRQRAGMGVVYNTSNLPPGFRTDGYGRVLRPDGSVFYDPHSPEVRDLSVTGEFGAQTGQLTAEQLQLLLAQQSQTGSLASAGVTGAGIQIGGMTISWPMLAIVGVGIYLLQRPGFEKRSR